MKNFTEEGFKRLANYIGLSFEKLSCDNISTCFQSGAKIVASSYVPGVMVVFAKISEEEIFNEFFFEFGAASKCSNLDGYLFNYDN